MKKSILILSLLILLGTGIIQAENKDAKNNPNGKPKFKVGAIIGTNGGFGAELNGMVSNITQDLPISLRFTFGYSSLKPGISGEARRIFINNATNGVPEESGRKTDYKFDIIIPFQVLSLQKSYLYAGPRYTKFIANFKYIGGNEDFDVRSNQWGFGTGLESFFAINQKFDLVLTTGLDYMQSAVLQGHDTSYDPDGITGNERETYTFEDADNAINQPKLELKLMIGVSYSF